MNKLESVPVDTITGKDLDYLSDMFQWNYEAYKRVNNDIENVSSQEIVDFYNETINFFDNNLGVILNIVSNPGGDIDE